MGQARNRRVRVAAQAGRPATRVSLKRVLSGLAPASITCALGRAATSRYAASRMASTVMVRRRNWSLRQSAGTLWLWRDPPAGEMGSGVALPLAAANLAAFVYSPHVPGSGLLARG